MIYLGVVHVFKNGKVWTMYKYDGDHEDHTTPCYFAPIGVSTEDDDGNDIEPKEKLVLNVPDMSKLKKVVLGGKRSGIIVVSAK